MCVFRVKGEHFDPRAWIENTGLDVVCVDAPGESLFDRFKAKGKPRMPGFHANVSRKPWDDCEGQVEDAIGFLTEHQDELTRLAALTEVESLQIDFPVREWESEGPILHKATLPVALLRAAAEAGVEVIMTVYAWSPEDEAE